MTMMTKGTVLVTGGSRGIGRAVIRRMIDDGFDVLHFSRTPPPELFEGEVFESVDLSNPQQTKQAVSDWSRKKDILHLVNNAGMIRAAAIEQVSLEDVHDMVALNLVAPILLTQALVPVMRARKYGRIVNIGSRAALGKEGRTVYGGTKAGLVGMTRTWALELAADGITVNVIAPGPIATELYQASNPPDSPQTQKLVASIPVKRVGKPQEVAHAVAMLMDERAGFITGQLLYVCGGVSVGQAG